MVLKSNGRYQIWLPKTSCALNVIFFALYSMIHVCHYLLVIFLSTSWSEIHLHPYLLVWSFNTLCKLSLGVHWNYLVPPTVCLWNQSWPDHIIQIERHLKFFLHKVYTKLACDLIMCCGLDSRSNIREYW